MLLKLKYIFIIATIICLSNYISLGQGQDKSVIFSGRVVADRNSEFLPNAYVFNPQAGRGTLTDDFGNFSLYVYPGDSVVFSYVGYKKKYYIIPRTNDQTHVATVFRTEDEFKKAFLDMKLDNEAGRRALAKNLEQSKLNVLSLRAGLSGAGNFRNFSDQMTYAATNRSFYQSPLLTLTNPFAWANFIKSIKNGDLKRDDYKKAYEDAPSEGISRQKFLKEQKTGN
jgi:hypothetical protein